MIHCTSRDQESGSSGRNVLRRGAVVAAVLAAALASFPAFAWPPGGNGGGNGGGGNGGGGEDPPPPPNIVYEYVSLGRGGATGMNDWGDVVGVYDGGAFVATVDVETGQYVREDLNDFINPDSGVVLIHAGDINNSGQIAGSALFDVDGTLVERACRLTPWIVDDDGYVVVEDLDAANPTRASRADAINDNGDVAGRLLIAETFLYTDDDGLLELRAFGTGLNDGLSEFGISINNLAQVAGGTMSADWEGWRFTPHFDANGMIDGGVMQSLGVIKENRGGVRQSSATDINDLGEVVGGSTAGARAYHAYRYTDGAGMVDLGDLGGGRCYGWGINNQGEVVGRDTVAGRAFLYTDEFKMFELDSRINGLPAEWFGRLWPKRINADGDICGNAGDGEFNYFEAFVLRRVGP